MGLFDVDPLENRGRGKGSGLEEELFCTAHTCDQAIKLLDQGIIPLKSDDPIPKFVSKEESCQYTAWDIYKSC